MENLKDTEGVLARIVESTLTARERDERAKVEAERLRDEERRRAWADAATELDAALDGPFKESIQGGMAPSVTARERLRRAIEIGRGVGPPSASARRRRRSP